MHSVAPSYKYEFSCSKLQKHDFSCSKLQKHDFGCSKLQIGIWLLQVTNMHLVANMHSVAPSYKNMISVAPSYRYEFGCSKLQICIRLPQVTNMHSVAPSNRMHICIAYLTVPGSKYALLSLQLADQAVVHRLARGDERRHRLVVRPLVQVHVET